MNKVQIAVLSAAFAAVVFLMCLPRVVVENNTNLGKTEKNQTTADKTDQNATDPETTEHHSPVSEAAQQAIDLLRQKFFDTTDAKSKKEVLDSLTQVYRAANLFDSAAHYLSLYAKQTQQTPDYLRAADGYFEAFGFAVNPQKNTLLAENARAMYEQVLKAEPKNHSAKVRYALTFTVSQQPMNAVRYLREVLTDDPSNQEALFQLGVLSIQSGQYDKAVERFKALLAKYPNDQNARLNLGISLANLGKKDLALKELDAVLKTASDTLVKLEAQRLADELRQ